MRILQPLVLMLAQTETHDDNVAKMLNHLGAPEWETDAETGGEEIIEIGGRLCYRSFAPGLNKNVTKVREGNKPYIKNILAQKHGSVLEHAYVTFAFLDVSRIFTHEVCRHRAGTAISQESMRYVRLDDIGMYMPDCMADAFLHQPLNQTVKDVWVHTVRTCERAISTLTEIFQLNTQPSFEVKKMITSALRRLAPGGHTTNIMMTANHRAWRHMIELRTSAGAEEEIRKVFREVATQLQNTFPAIYQDMHDQAIPPGPLFFDNSKV